MKELTDRQRQILELVAAGFSNRRIARELSLVEKTVEHHVLDIGDRLGLPKRGGDFNRRALAAVRWAAGERGCPGHLLCDKVTKVYC